MRYGPKAPVGMNRVKVWKVRTAAVRLQRSEGPQMALSALILGSFTGSDWPKLIGFSKKTPVFPVNSL